MHRSLDIIERELNSAVISGKTVDLSKLSSLTKNLFSIVIECNEKDENIPHDFSFTLPPEVDIYAE